MSKRENNPEDSKAQGSTNKKQRISISKSNEEFSRNRSDDPTFAETESKPNLFNRLSNKLKIFRKSLTNMINF